MDYVIREGVGCIRTELKYGTITITRNSHHMVRLRADELTENCMRVFAYNNVLHIKCISPYPANMELLVPDSVKMLDLNSESCNLVLEDIELDTLTASSGGELDLTNVTIKKSCKLSVDNADIILKACDLMSMNLELYDGTLDFQNTVLHGNNTAFMKNAMVRGKLKGALVDYVVSAGYGISPDNVIVNDHLLSEFPNRKNVQNCAWLLLAGSMKNTARLTIQKPRMRY